MIILKHAYNERKEALRKKKVMERNIILGPVKAGIKMHKALEKRERRKARVRLTYGLSEPESNLTLTIDSGPESSYIESSPSESR